MEKRKESGAADKEIRKEEVEEKPMKISIEDAFIQMISTIQLKNESVKVSSVARL